MPCFGISVWYVMFVSIWLLSHPSQAGLCVWPNFFFFFLKQKESIGNISKSFITKRHWSLNGGQEFSWLLIHIEDRRLWGYFWGCFYYWSGHPGSLFVCIQSLATICFWLSIPYDEGKKGGTKILCENLDLLWNPDVSSTAYMDL